MCGCLVCPFWLEIAPLLRWCENIVFYDPSYYLHCCWFLTEIILWVWLHWLKNILDIILSYFYVVGHVNLDLSCIYIFQGHTKIIMDFSFGDFYFPGLILVNFP